MSDTGLEPVTSALSRPAAGELWALRRADVDVEGRRLVVERTLTSESGHLIFRNVTKPDGSRRVVSLALSEWAILGSNQ